jgi:hypothetical protein
MTQHVLLDNVAHKNLRIQHTYAPGHGFDSNLARAFPVELGILQAEYPLFFIKNTETGHFESIALLGFEEGENLYLGGDRWLARAQPLSVQRQPFLIGFQERQNDGATERVPVITVDLDDPSISQEEGDPVFLPHGGEAPLLERMNAVLATIHEGHQAAQTFSRVLVGLDLLEPLRLDIQFDNGRRHSVEGLFRINEDRLAKLDGGSLQTLHEGGHLQQVYMMLASLPNLEALIRRKNQNLAG